MTTTEQLPAFLRRHNGRLEIELPPTRDAVFAEVQKLEPRSQLSFADAVASAVDLDNDYYDGWNFDCDKLLTALLLPVDKLVKAYHLTVYNQEIINLYYER